MRVMLVLVAVSLFTLAMVGCDAEIADTEIADTADTSGTSLMSGTPASDATAPLETTTSSSQPLRVNLIQVFGGSLSGDASLATEDGMRPENVEWSYMTAVTVGGPGLVAGGVSHPGGGKSDAAVWVSSDGFEWTRIEDELGVFGDAMSPMAGPLWRWISDVVSGSFGVIAVGADGILLEHDGAIWVSEDGLLWERVSDDQALFGGEGDQFMHSVVQMPGLVVVVGESEGHAAAWVSSDGVQWARAEVNDESIDAGIEPSVMNDVAVTGVGLVAVGSAGIDLGPAVWLSADGVTWDRLLDSMAGQQSGFSTGESAMSPMTAIAAGEHGLVAIGAKLIETVELSRARGPTSGPLVWTSDDGYEWQSVEAAFLEATDEQEPGRYDYLKRVAPILLEDVSWVGDRMFAIGRHVLAPSANALPSFVTLWSSTDGGSTWHTAAETALPPTESWRGARAFTLYGDSLVLVGNDDLPTGRHPEYGWPTWADAAAVWIADAADDGSGNG